MLPWPLPRGWAWSPVWSTSWSRAESPLREPDGLCCRCSPLPCSGKAAADSEWMSGHGPVPIKLYFQTQVGLWFADRRCRTCFSTVLPGDVRLTVCCLSVLPDAARLVALLHFALRLGQCLSCPSPMSPAPCRARAHLSICPWVALTVLGVVYRVPLTSPPLPCRCLC